MIATAERTSQNKTHFDDFLAAYQEKHLSEVLPAYRLNLVTAVIGSISDVRFFEGLLDVYQDTGDVIYDCDLLEYGNIEFFYKNKQDLMLLAGHMADEVGQESVAMYLHNTMGFKCSLEGIQCVIERKDVPTVNDIINDDEESFYNVSEWLSRSAVMFLMDEVLNHSRSSGR